MRIVFFGTPQFAVPSLQKLWAHSEMEVIGVVTQPDKPRGRGNEVIPSEVKKTALAYQIPVWQPKSVKKDVEILSYLKNTQADVFVVVAYGQILSKEILQMPKYGCINVHGSILPKYRGAAPIQWSIYHGESETGITTMLMDEGLDTGAMLLKAFIPINLSDNAHYIGDRLSNLGADLLIKTLLKLPEIPPILQDNSLATYAPLIKKSDYGIDWSRSAVAIHNQVRAFYPHCVSLFRGETIKVLTTMPIEDITISGEIGAIVGLVKNEGPVIQTGEGLLLFKEVQKAGKKPQSGKDFINGSRLTLAERFGIIEV